MRPVRASMIADSVFIALVISFDRKNVRSWRPVQKRQSSSRGKAGPAYSLRSIAMRFFLLEDLPNVFNAREDDHQRGADDSEDEDRFQKANSEDDQDRKSTRLNSSHRT